MGPCTGPGHAGSPSVGVWPCTHVSGRCCACSPCWPGCPAPRCLPSRSSTWWISRATRPTGTASIPWKPIWRTASTRSVPIPSAKATTATCAHCSCAARSTRPAGRCTPATGCSLPANCRWRRTRAWSWWTTDAGTVPCRWARGWGWRPSMRRWNAPTRSMSCCPVRRCPSARRWAAASSRSGSRSAQRRRPVTWTRGIIPARGRVGRVPCAGTGAGTRFR